MWLLQAESPLAKVTGLPMGLGGNASKSFSGWEATDLARLVALLALVAIAAWAVELFVPDVTLPAPAWMIAGGAGALSALFVLYRIASKPSLGVPELTLHIGNATIGVSKSTSFGIWLALLASAATVAGAYLRKTEST